MTPRKRVYRLTTVILAFSLPVVLFAQGNCVFGPNVKVNDDPGGQAYHTTYSSGAHTIAARGDTVYIAYRGDQTGQSCIYFSKSTNGGQTWTPGLRVSYPESGIIQSLAIDNNGDIFIAYTHVSSPNYRDIHFTRSTDGGLSFTYPIRVEDDTLPNQMCPSIAVDTSGQYVFVVWQDSRTWDTTGWDVYFSRSTDGGLTFGPNVRVDDTGIDTTWQLRPCVATDRSGDNIYVVWHDGRNVLTRYDIYFTRSTDGGVSFLPNVLVNDTMTSWQWNPSLAVDTLGRIFVAWRNELQPRGCYFARSDDGGLSFGPEVRVTDAGLDIPGDLPSIAVDDSDGVYIAWGRDFRLNLGNDRIYFAYSPNAGDSFYANVRVDDLPPNQDYWLWNPTLAINKDKTVFIAWEDDRNDPSHTNTDIYFASGAYVGIEEWYSYGAVNSMVEVVPNPCNYRFALISPASAIRSIRIFDVLGSLVKNIEVESKHMVTCDLTFLPAGLYFVRVETEQNAVVKKITKIK